MPNRCAWTNEESDRVKEIVLNMPDRFGMHPKPTTFYVLPEYEQKLRRFTHYFERFGLTFVISFLILILVLLGIEFVVFPFNTPKTVKLLGFRGSILRVRTIGFITILLGVWYCLVR